MIISEILVITKNGEHKLKRMVYDRYKRIMKSLDDGNIIPDLKNDSCFNYSFTYRSNYIIYNISKNEFEYLVIDNANMIKLTFDNIIFFNIPLEYRNSNNISKIFYPLYHTLNDDYAKILSNSTKQEFCVFNPSFVKCDFDTITTPKRFRHIVFTTIETNKTKHICSSYIPLKYHNHKSVDYIQTYYYGFFTISVKLRIEIDNMQIRVLDRPKYHINNEKHDKPDEIIKILEELKEELTAKVVAKEFENEIYRYRLYNSQKDILKLITVIIIMIEACETIMPDMIIQKLRR